MGCTSPLQSKYYRERRGIEPSSGHHSTTLNQNETQLLKLMFEDVAARSPGHAMTKEHFFEFFHINGQWGHSIFKRFDRNNSGEINFDEFRAGIEELVKGSVKKRVHALFDFYDTDRQGTISFGKLLQMLYSYPKDQLRQILQDWKFLATMSKEDQEYLMKESNLNKMMLQYDAEPSLDKTEQPKQPEEPEFKRTQSETVNEEEKPSTTTKETKEQNPNPAPNAEVQKASSDVSNNTVSNQWDKFVPQKSSTLVQQKTAPPYAGYRPPSLKRHGHSTNESVLLKSKIKIAANTTLLVKRYATFLFAEHGLDPETGSLSYEQFCKLVQGHERIFDSYFMGFHNYIWEIPQRYTIPHFLAVTPDLEGECLEIDMKDETEHHRHLILYRTTLFVMKHNDKKVPEAIKNMEGLLIDQHQLIKRDLYGFIVRHRDGVYPEKAYMFKHQAVQEEWLRFLDDYRKVPLIARYIVEKKVGTGNFSIVYRAVEKDTGNRVAIKEIAKFKLSKESKDIIQHECSILERCHHPNIIHFVEMSETKNHIYIVTELMTEGDLYQYVRIKGFLEEFEASIIVKQIIQAIMYINAMGLIHRDLKAENILVQMGLIQVHKREDKTLIERVKLIDFGFAVYASMLSDVPLSERFLGSLNYVAPEVIQQQDFDQSIDNFSLGVIMYFMLCGSLPFEAVMPEETKRLTIECKPPMEGQHWANISDKAKDLLKKLIAPKSERISLHDAIKHPWISEPESLQAYIGKNKRLPHDRQTP